MDKIKILYVDDEEANRNGFHANFRLEYYVITCASGYEALEIMKNVPGILIVIADQKMNGITGLQLLEAIDKEKSIIKIAVTAQRDNSDLETAYIEGRIFDYLDKPWQAQDLEKLIENALNHLK